MDEILKHLLRIIWLGGTFNDRKFSHKGNAGFKFISRQEGMKKRMLKGIANRTYISCHSLNYALLDPILVSLTILFSNETNWNIESADNYFTSEPQNLITNFYPLENDWAGSCSVPPLKDAMIYPFLGKNHIVQH